ncbi:MAG TPA: baseplate J/gp47 family protein, partial [Acidimicrobiales bacterium]|nr:baseplate J/gp47 family protein [Acidimicrobiales bacterium]
STLEVYVVAAGAGPAGGVQWQEVGSFYEQAADATVFVVSRSPDQSVTTVTFGDGVNGARLPSGTSNVVANYRYGSGAASPPAGRLTTILQPQPNLASIANPVAVLPGADPQSPADVRADAPASVLTFGRAISAVDYEVVAAQASGVSRVSAVWTFDQANQRTLVKLYVGDDEDAVAAAQAALAGAEDPNRPIVVTLASPVELALSGTLVVAAGAQLDPVAAAASTALLDPATGLFSPSQMGVGQRLYRSAIDAALMQPGVVAVHGLEVSWVVRLGGLFDLELVRVLDEAADPGEGAYFDLAASATSLQAVSAGG